MNRHLFHTLESDKEMIESNVDEHGDSYCRDLTMSTLQALLNTMSDVMDTSEDYDALLQLEEHGMDLDYLPGALFRRMVVYFNHADINDLDASFAKVCINFGSGRVVANINDTEITHIVAGVSSNIQAIRKHISQRSAIPRLVSLQWVLTSWKEKTILDESRE